MKYQDIEQILAMHLYLTEGDKSAANQMAAPSNSSVYSSVAERHEKARSFFEERLGVKTNGYFDDEVIADVKKLLRERGPMNKDAVHKLISDMGHPIDRAKFRRLTEKPELIALWKKPGRPKKK